MGSLADWPLSEAARTPADSWNGVGSSHPLRYDPHMTATIVETPYCRLYIDTAESREAVQTLLNRSAFSHFGELRVEAQVFKNDFYEPGRTKHLTYDAIAASIWTAEVDTEANEAVSFEVFQIGMVEMIRGLRARGMRVTASCDFEDIVAQETGWNWSVDTPEPPR